MNIIDSNLKFKGLTYGNNPRKIILHHAEAINCSIEDIHTWHLHNGWSGCGYHYFIRKNGSIYKGRPENSLGAHCINYNSISIGICVEGNYMIEHMPLAQKNSLIELIKYLCGKYGIKEIYGHGELNSTNCPGTNYPIDEIRRETILEFGRNTVINYPGYLIKVNANLKDNNVKIIQEKLMEKGYSVGGYGADGYFGNATLNAIKSFQRDNGILVDGIVGRGTWERLVK
ncbi:N-acetylmuramoyl-L-alanine amidase (plasmid) [Clostridium tetani]|uniref:peptidoglycan recognition protein family protein n=1 Tax=Clostridium tetani TaxID=1513 RepID=UPI000D208CC5|nr:N-acetylmuramoyl-L-alanine amidase [Clostridium tetani]AVP56063.1 N-acetylmuramoyl-L-alanine amidase [Clostridium tetani]RXI78858.1 N-acetylmuramoyl-L-alanine amidase [Clostridium tetani]WFN63254.1 N-acetylmuramoyl-L-alanine amidase [Clostridium tetani]SUY80170.1 putative N-acetylmuramoyl-L-alanine amidase [Clostridium tetani]BDR71150.1 N-acetylmuramoyl-L-alanine amidase [Clostridium tetani]